MPVRFVNLTVRQSYTLTLLRMVSIHPETTFARLRYSLGGDRPSQTARLAMSSVYELELHHTKGSIPTSTHTKPKPCNQSLLPILCIT